MDLSETPPPPPSDLGSLSAWDVAIRYHEFKSAFQRDSERKEVLRKLSAAAILDRARQILGAIVRPTSNQTVPESWISPQMYRQELDLEATLEESPWVGARSACGVMGAPELWYQVTQAKPRPIVLCVDTSLSMTGPKLALTAVALAVVLLEFDQDPIGIVAFENEAFTLKDPEERLSVADLVERFLDVPAQGYTHLEGGLCAAWRLSQRATQLGRGTPCSTVLISDGKYTAGRDPTYLAHRFSKLVLLKMGEERGSMELCRDLAHKGHGVLKQVGELEALPQVMYATVKEVLRLQQRRG